MRRYLLTAATLLALAGPVGCGKPADQGEPADVKGTIGLSLLTSDNPFFQDIAENMKAAAAKAGYEVIVTSGDRDVAKQQSQVKDFIVRKVSAIVLCPCDSKSIGPAIIEATEAGIPVFTADIACLDPSAQGKVVCHVATDNFSGGRQAAQAMIDAVGPTGGNVVVLDCKEIESCILRVDGFKEVIAEYNESAENKIEIVAELPGNANKEKGRSAAADAIQAHDDLVGIFAINDPSALGALAALEEAGRADQIVLIGFDGHPEAKKAIHDGKIYASPIQYPDRIGQMTMETILRYFNGEEIEKEILIPTSLFLKDTPDDGPADN